MMTGIIVKALSGFYYVHTQECGVIPCRGRGKLRHDRITPLVGDRVEITRLTDGSGRVDAILPRINQFQRPMVANIQQMIIVASGAIPVTDPFLIDRMIAMAEWKGCVPIICFNKCDLCRVDELGAVYERAGFQTIQVSAETGENMDILAGLLADKVSAFTGNSGVGKSSILNALRPVADLKVGEVSEKLGSGRHTTRHVELFQVRGGLVADTPGFSSLDADELEQVPKEELGNVFREFVPYIGQCRFNGCAHYKEKGCAVRDAVRRGEIARSRYESYVRLYEQEKAVKSWESSGKR